MMADKQVTKHDSDFDHAVWIRCFTAAISGRLAPSVPALQVAQDAAAIADAALEEERRRRKEQGPSAYEKPSQAWFP